MNSPKQSPSPSKPISKVSLANSKSSDEKSFSNMDTRIQSPSRSKQIKSLNSENENSKSFKNSALSKKYAPSNTSKKNLNDLNTSEKSVRKTKSNRVVNPSSIGPSHSRNGGLHKIIEGGKNGTGKRQEESNIAYRGPSRASNLLTIIRKSSIFKTVKTWYNVYISAEELIIKDCRIKDIVDNLHISQSQLRRLKNIFETIDVDRSGHVDLFEILDLIHTKKSPFVEVLFKNLIFDQNYQRITLEDFICVFARYCTFSRDNILRFCFDTFDTDGSGTINESEFVELLQLSKHK